TNWTKNDQFVEFLTSTPDCKCMQLLLDAHYSAYSVLYDEYLRFLQETSTDEDLESRAETFSIGICTLAGVLPDSDEDPCHHLGEYIKQLEAQNPRNEELEDLMKRVLGYYTEGGGEILPDDMFYCNMCMSQINAKNTELGDVLSII